MIARSEIRVYEWGGFLRKVFTLCFYNNAIRSIIVLLCDGS